MPPAKSNPTPSPAGPRKSRVKNTFAASSSNGPSKVRNSFATAGPGSGGKVRDPFTGGPGSGKVRDPFSGGPGSGSSSKEEKPGGILGLLGAVGSALSMPQQVVYKAGQGLGDVLQGHTGQGLRGLAGAVGEIATLGQAGGDIDFATATGELDADGTRIPTKLPRGLNTAIDIVADPLNLVTLGAGTAAKQVGKVATKELGEAAAKRLATQGLKKGLTEAEQTTLRTALVTGAEQAGSKNAAKTADKLLSKTAQRARGGLGVHVPFTDIGTSVIPGAAFEKAGAATGLTVARDAVKASAPVRSLAKAIIPGRAVAEAVGKDASEKVLSAGSRRFASDAATVSDLEKRLEAGVRSFEQAAGRKWSSAEDAIVHAALEGGPEAMAAAAKTHPALATLIDAGDSIRRSVTASQIEAGVLDPLLIHEDATYLKRLLTPEAQKAFDKAEKIAVHSWSSVSGALRQTSGAARAIDADATVEQINAAVATIQAGGTVADEALGQAVQGIAQKLPAGAKLFDESAVRSLAERGHSAARAVGAAKYVSEIRGITDDVGHKIMLSADDAATTGLPHGWVKFDLPKLGTFHAPAEVAAEVKRFMSVIGADDAVSNFDNMLRRWDRWWKVSVTASLPGGIPFALRNARSNMWMMFSDGMPARYMAEGRSLQREVSKTLAAHADDVAKEGVESVLKRELGGREWKMFDAARREGLIGTGFYAFDIEGLTGAKKVLSGGPAKKAVRAALGTEGVLAKTGLKLNGAIEEHARLSHFLYSVDRLGSIEKAAEHTKAVLFDYGRLTPFEQQRIKRVIPFYTFMRKNVPAQFARFIENPARIAVPEKISNAVTTPLDEDAPEYQKRRGSRLLKFGLPGFVSTPERPLQSAAAALEPFSQTAASIIPGKQGGLEPSGGIGQAGRSLLSQIGGGPASAAKAVAQEAAGTNLFTGYQLAKGESDKRLLSAALPQNARFPSLTARLPTAEQRRKDRQKKQKTLAEVAAILGIKLEPQTGAPK